MTSPSLPSQASIKALIKEHHRCVFDLNCLKAAAAGSIIVNFETLIRADNKLDNINFRILELEERQKLGVADSTLEQELRGRLAGVAADITTLKENIEKQQVAIKMFSALGISVGSSAKGQRDRPGNPENNKQSGRGIRPQPPANLPWLRLQKKSKVQKSQVSRTVS
jgi:hypothetical protein